ncbi:MAG: hypothetical protein GC184_04345 [Rhizobiales bacterium]|nr:hypothetical protein [Hyphomicrobiales bacterium]
MTSKITGHLTTAFMGLAFLTIAGFATAVHATPPDNSHNPALPQNNVKGTDYMLHNSVFAEEAGTAVSTMETAIRRCDSAGYRRAENILQTLRSRSGDRAKSFTIVVNRDAEAEDEATINGLIENYNQRWKACESRNLADNGRRAILAGGGFHAGRINVPALAYLGLEQTLTLIQVLSIVKGEDKGTVTGADFSGSVFEPNSNLLFGFGLSRSATSMRSDYTNIDPAGDTLLIPGPLGGASGFALPTAGGLNVVTTANFSSDYAWNTAYAKMGYPFACDEFSFLPFGGLAYTRAEFDAHFDGSIPGYARDFAYSTSLRTNSYSPMIGVDVERKFQRFNLHAGGLLAVDINDTSGHDSLAFTGVADSRVDLSNNDATISGRAWAGVSFGNDASPFKLSLDLSWIHAGNVPKISRDGTNPTTLKLESANAVVGSIGAVIRF